MDTAAHQVLSHNHRYRILVRATNWVGDAVMTLPALDALGGNFPASRITVLAKPWVAPVYESHPAVNDILTFDKGGGSIYELWRVIRQIRKRRFHMAILFQNAFEAALITFLAGVPCRIGYRTDGRGLLLTRPIKRTHAILKVHQVDYYCAILRAMNWRAEPEDPRLHVLPETVDAAKNLLVNMGTDPHRFILGLGPGAVFGGAKRWSPERFAAVADRAVRQWNAQVVVFGSGREREIADRVCGQMKSKALNLAGKTSLKEAMAIISLCRFFVTNDSGLMHVAAGLNIPLVAVFGSTDSVATGPRGGHSRIVKHDVPCAPCLQPECNRDHLCMRAITTEQVWQAMEKLKEDMN